MPNIRFFAPLLAAVALFVPSSRNASAQHPFELVTGKPFDSAVPRDFYLEGNAIPTQKRNAVLVRLPSGARALFALIDTTGYSSEIVTKYVGMMVTEGDVSVCGQKVTAGSYGFGWSRPAAGVDGPGKFSLYNQAGAKLTECTTPRDANLKQPTPLKVVVNQDGSARLYYGRHGLDLQ
jgi:hypothetical protein